MKISILVITYNHAAYISKALEGLLIQRDLEDFEIIVCDDSSTDRTVSIAREMLASSQNTTFCVNERNLGITRNYQQSFARCKGEYICILEGDDYWIDPDKIKKQINFLDCHPECSMCSHPFIVQKDVQEILNFPKPTDDTEYLLFNGRDLILDEGIISNFSTCCYRRSMLEKISPRTYDTISYEWMINISIAEFGFLARINEPMSVYRHSSTGSWTQIPLERQMKGMHDILPVYDEILGRRYHMYFEKKREMLSNKLIKLTSAPKRSETGYSLYRVFTYIKRKMLYLIAKT